MVEASCGGGVVIFAEKQSVHGASYSVRVPSLFPTMTTLLESLPDDKLCDAVKALFDAGVLNMPKDGYMILKKQVKEKQEKTAIALLALKTSDGTPAIDPSQENNAVFYWAATNGMMNLFHQLLGDTRVHPDMYCFEETGKPVSPLSSAAYEGHIEVVRYLLGDARVEPRGFTNAAKNKHWDILDMLVATGKGDPTAEHNRPLRDAVWNGQETIVSRLLSYEKVDPNDHPVGQISAVGMALLPGTSLSMAKLILEDKRANYITEEDLKTAEEENYTNGEAKHEYLLSLCAKPKPVATVVEDPKPLAVVQPPAVQRIEVHVYVHTDQKQQRSGRGDSIEGSALSFFYSFFFGTAI